MNARIGALTSLSLLLAGCAMVPARFVHVDDGGQSIERYAGSGDAVVYGRAYLREAGGGFADCAGQPVALFPRTPAFQQAVNLAKEHVRPISAGEDASLKAVARTTTCDAHGVFRFANLPRAPWYVYAIVGSASQGHQGRELIGEVDTSGGGYHTVVLSDKDLL